MADLRIDSVVRLAPTIICKPTVTTRATVSASADGRGDLLTRNPGIDSMPRAHDRPTVAARTRLDTTCANHLQAGLVGDGNRRLRPVAPR